MSKYAFCAPENERQTVAIGSVSERFIDIRRSREVAWCLKRDTSECSMVTGIIPRKYIKIRYLRLEPAEFSAIAKHSSNCLPYYQT
jgi:hypothetical protein